MATAGPSIDTDAAAAEIVAVLGEGRQVRPFSERHPGFDLDDAYRVAAAVHRLRMARGERPVGRKIGFTNRRIWDEYGVYAPIWGHVYDTTLHDLDAVAAGFPLGGLAEPRIEPEIIFGMSAAPHAAMDDQRLLECIEWVAHGFELVQSIYPGWVFTAADTVAAYGLHGALLVGRRVPVAGDLARWEAALPAFRIELACTGAPMEQGAGSHVLDGPLPALRHLLSVLEAAAEQPPLRAAEIVTTGTLTRALPVEPGQCWSTRIDGIDLPRAEVQFR
jgi:2-oxo-3-hexenedioate decarboxylase